MTANASGRRKYTPIGMRSLFGWAGFSSNPMTLAVGVELGDAEPLRVGHAVQERAGAPRAGLELVRRRRRAPGPRRMLSPSTQQNASSPTKSRARPIAWAMPSAPRW